MVDAGGSSFSQFNTATGSAERVAGFWLTAIEEAVTWSEERGLPRVQQMLGRPKPVLDIADRCAEAPDII